MASITKRLKSFRSITNRKGAKRQKRQRGRTDRVRSGTNSHLVDVGKSENTQGIASHDAALPEPAQCTILFPVPE
jgi:hypothetical protein